MAKGNQNKLTRAQRKTRTYQIVFVAITVIVLLSMILALVTR